MNLELKRLTAQPSVFYQEAVVLRTENFGFRDHKFFLRIIFWGAIKNWKLGGGDIGTI